MTSCKLALLAVLAAVLAAAFAGPPAAQAANHLCKQQFALCTSAPCIPDPTNPKLAMCRCDVEEGPNLASVPCDTVKPHTDKGVVRRVYSQFALTQWEQGKKTLTCPSGTPWTWCLNKPCTVDPADPSKAMCACDIIQTGASVTAGGDCDAKTCRTAYWSAAPADAFSGGTDFLLKALDIKTSPVQACAAQ